MLISHYQVLGAFVTGKKLANHEFCMEGMTQCTHARKMREMTNKGYLKSNDRPLTNYKEWQITKFGLAQHKKMRAMLRAGK